MAKTTLPTKKRKYVEIASPVSGLELSVPSTMITNTQTPLCSEVYFKDGEVKKMTGWTYFAMTNVAVPLTSRITIHGGVSVKDIICRLFAIAVMNQKIIECRIIALLQSQKNMVSSIISRVVSGKELVGRIIARLYSQKNVVCSIIAFTLPIKDIICRLVVRLISEKNMVCRIIAVAFQNCHAHWMLNETSGTSAADSSGHGRNGTLIGAITWAPGKLNNCLNFSATTQYVDCGQAGNFERTQPFSFDFWYKTASTGTQIIASKILNSGNYTGWQVWYDGTSTNRVYFDLISVVSTSWIRAYFTDVTVSNNTWHHFVITYDGSSTAAGVKFYYDNTLKTTSVDGNNLSSSTLTAADFQISGRGTGAALGIIGLLDELVIYERALSVVEVAARWNSGAGTQVIP